MALEPEPESVNIQMISIVNHLFTSLKYDNLPLELFLSLFLFVTSLLPPDPGSDTDRGPVTKEGC